MISIWTTAQKSVWLSARTVAAVSSAILTKKNFRTLNWKLNSLKQSGLVDYWRSKISDMSFLKIKETPLPKAFNMRHMLDSIQILIIGYIFSIVAFVFELICSSLFQSTA